MTTIARLQRVTYTYPGGQRPALRQVTLALEPTEVVLVVGASGSGKSTLLRALAGLVPHFHGGVFAGRVTVFGRDTRQAQARDLAGDVGLVFQDPESQAVMTTVEREIAFGLENLGVPGQAVTRRVEEALIALGLSHLRHAELATLSGGELQKVALAAVMATQPRLLLLDEPTSQLDPVSSEDLLAAVRRLSEDTGATIVLAEHRVERCLHLATRVLYMEDGAVVLDGQPQQFARWAASAHSELLPPVARLFAQKPPAEGAHRSPTSLEATGVSAQLLPLTVKEARHLLEGETARGDLLEARRDAREGQATAAQPPSPETVLEVRNLSAAHVPGELILERVNLRLHRGELVALMGENGAGKTTLVRHFNGLLKPVAGEVRLLGHNVADLTVAQAARFCGYLGQDPNAYFVKETVADEIEYSLDQLDVEGGERARLRARALAAFDVEPLLPRHPRDLSGGERTRVALALVAVSEPPLLVLDEPTRGMDPLHKADLGRLLTHLVADGRCVLVVTHDVEFAARFTDRVVILGDGGVLVDGPVREVLHGALFFSTQINRLLRDRFPGVLHEGDLMWRTQRHDHQDEVAAVGNVHPALVNGDPGRAT